MPIRFRCPHCQKPLSVKDHLAGKKAACPACKQPVTIPTSAAPSVPAAEPAPGSPPAPALPPEDVDALAAAALADEPKQEEANGAAAARTIDFNCEYCDTELHVPLAEAGKRMSCPNPECRQIIRVPTPKADKPKDWRDVKQGKTVEQLREPEKISEDAWGSQTDKGRAHKQSFEEAGLIEERRPRQRVGVRGWITRVLVGSVAAGVLIGLAVWGRSVTARTRDKAEVRDLLAFIEGGEPKVTEPVLRAEVLRAAGDLQIREPAFFKQGLDRLRMARAAMRGAPAKGPDVDLFLRDLLLTQVELGGTEQDQINGEKLHWKDGARTELRQTLLAIKDHNARTIAMRELATRLLEKGQKELALGFAAELANTETDPRSLVRAQQKVLQLIAEDKGDGAPVKVPIQPNGAPDISDRVAYAEFHARRGEFDKAMEIAKGKAQSVLEQTEALIGAAGVVLSDRKTKAADAEPLVDAALEIAKTQKNRLPPWQQLQLVRYTARVKGADAAKDLADKIHTDFRPRAYLEMIKGECERSAEPVPFLIVAPLETLAPKEQTPAFELAWCALARQHAKLGQAADIEARAKQAENGRFWPMVRVGEMLGQRRKQ